MAAGHRHSAAGLGGVVGTRQRCQIVRLGTYARSPVAVPFYEEHAGYSRRSIVFQKEL